MFEVTSSSLSQCKISYKKNLRSGPKWSYVGSFWPMFEKSISIFEITTFEFANMQSFMFMKKNKYLRPKLF